MRDELQQVFLERGEVIDGALAALLGGHHVLIIGPPGTAKSMLADELCRRLDGATYFQWLLTKFTTPEELFGAVSLDGAGARRVPARHHAQTARGAHRLSRRGVQGELLDPQRHAHPDERAPLPQRTRQWKRAADHAVRRQQRAARGRRAAGALRSLPGALRRLATSTRSSASSRCCRRAPGGAHDAVARRAARRAGGGRRGGDPGRDLSVARRPAPRAGARASSSPPIGATASRSTCCAPMPISRGATR